MDDFVCFLFNFFSTNDQFRSTYWLKCVGFKANAREIPHGVSMYGRGDYLVKFFNNKKQKQISSCKAISQFFCFGSFFFSQKKKTQHPRAGWIFERKNSIHHRFIPTEKEITKFFLLFVRKLICYQLHGCGWSCCCWRPSLVRLSSMRCGTKRHIDSPTISPRRIKV